MTVVDLASHDDAIFAGTGEGLFLSCDGGSSWSPVNANLDNQNVYSFNTDSEYCYVGTYGMEVWRINSSELLRGVTPQARPEKPKLLKKCDVLSLSHPVNSGEIAWYRNDLPVPEHDDIVLHVTDSAYYKVEIKNYCGSTFSDPIYSTGKRSVKIYNVITPNGDGFNDTYELSNSLLGSNIEVYNRWGKLVYENTSYQNDWNAVDLSPGVYFYVINNTCYGSLKGTLSVLAKP